MTIGAGNAQANESLIDYFGPEQEMAWFDQLPYAIREAYRYASNDYSVYQGWWALVNGVNTVQEIVEALTCETSGD